MVRRTLVILAVSALAAAAQLQLRAEPAPGANLARGNVVSLPQFAAAAAANAADGRALLDRYCVACHNERTRTADLTLDSMDVSQVGDAAAAWEHVVRRLRAGEMPPAGRPRPDAEAAHAFVAWLETELDRAALAAPDPGRSAVHRLNRVEYANAVRDLFGLEIDANALLPADDEHHGFDNIAEVLSVSPTLIDRYLAAAQRISQLVVGDTALRPVAHTYPVHGRMNQDGAVSLDLPLGSRGGVAVEHHFPVAGEYVIRVSLRKQEYGYVRGMGQPHLMDVRLDGARVGTFTVGREWEDGQLPPMGYAGKFDQVYDSRSFPEWELYALNADRGLDVRVPVSGGRHRVGVAFERQSALPEGLLPLPADRSTYSHGQDEMQDGNPAVSVVQIIGPYDPDGTADLATRDALFTCDPAGADAGDERACAETILAGLARRAFRRPAAEADVDTLLDFYEMGRAEGGFQGGIQAAIERLLVDPEFLFRIEADPAGAAPGTAYHVSDIELASRLSFFLWSSIPDDELLGVAERGELSDPGVLDGQVRRMLADPRSRALVENFAGQWLQLRKLRNAAPDTATYTAFDENLREAMWQETELFLESQLRADRPLLDMLRADHTFVNERLARHYGIPDVHGVHFRRVDYPDDSRGGLLGACQHPDHHLVREPHLAGGARRVAARELPRHAALAAPARRAEPAHRGRGRGAAVGARAPRAAPRERGLRELSQRHRSPRVRPRVVRRHRALAGHQRGGTPFDTGIPIDASGTLVDGTEVHGLAGLRAVILDREEQFVETVAEKMLTYALGRTLEHYDMPVVRQISRESETDEITWSSLVSGIVKSTPS